MMRRFLGAAAALAVAGAAQAQPMGHYTGNGANYAYSYEPPLAYGSDGYFVPDVTYYNGYDAYRRDSIAAPDAGQAAVGGAMVVGPPHSVAGHPAYDHYGPDPNGSVGPGGFITKCKIIKGPDGYGRRRCW